MSKYKCIYDISRECIYIPKGTNCSEHCYKAYQQGVADALNALVRRVKDLDRYGWSNENRVLKKLRFEEDIVQIAEQLKEMK